MSGPAQQNTDSGNFIGDCYIARKCFESRGTSLLAGDAVFKSMITVEKGATICNGLIVDTITEKVPGQGVSILSELKVDVINEDGLGTGVEIEGVVLKDGMVSVPVTQVVQCIRDMNNDTEVCANDNDTITMDVVGVEKCRISANGAIQLNSGAASGIDSLACGASNASGLQAFAGGNSTSSGVRSFSSGTSNTSSGNSAASFGCSNTASAPYAFASGNTNNVSGTNSMASGFGNIVSGTNSLATGSSNAAPGNNALVGGQGSLANSDQSVVWGSNCVAGVGDYAVALGNYSQATALLSFARGERASASGDGSFASGKADVTALLSASGLCSHVFGRADGTGQNIASGIGAMCTGYSLSGQNNIASGNGSFVAGTGCRATASRAVAMGLNNLSSGQNSFTSGNGNTASASGSVAMGNGGVSSGDASTTLGLNCQATNDGATAGGNDSVANGQYSFAHGFSNLADAFYSTCFGQETTCAPSALGGFADGVSARAISRAQWCRASGKIAIDGDAQTSMYHYSGVTSATAITELFLGSAGSRAVVPNNHSWNCTLDIVGRCMVTNGDYCEKFLICVRNASNILSFTKISMAKIENGILVGSVISISSFMGNSLVVSVAAPNASLTHWAATLTVTQVG